MYKCTVYLPGALLHCAVGVSTCRASLDILLQRADAVASFSVVALSIGILVSAGQQPYLHASEIVRR